MLIEKLLSDEVNNDDFLGDEFFYFLDQFKCRTKVSKENVHEVIVEIARQEVIQKPHLMASCWQNVFTSLGKTKAFIQLKQPLSTTGANRKKAYHLIEIRSKRGFRKLF